MRLLLVLLLVGAVIIGSSEGSSVDVTKGDCILPSKSGSCRALFRRYYWDARTNSCKRFAYGGCRGNNNNFKSLDDCERGCRKHFQKTPVNSIKF
ncbi:unnamed protein product [Allacma fusca]|uniref:BPTI/Kunitz inhibitor domain-containing protein n=1 Tax=Allacma fusca TaxID=39272 RepID=A0A8J2L1P0_9HEXA|nr:unnamed protein product [Allacma fusca]